MAAKDSVYTRIYTDMGGVDFSGEPSAISAQSFAYLENMYRDYAASDGLGVETVPGYRPVCRYGAGILAIHPHPRELSSLLVHAGDSLFSLRTDLRDAAPAPIPLPRPSGVAPLSAERESRSAILEGRLFLADGCDLHVTDGETLSSVTEEAYVPLLYVDGVAHRQKNLLTDKAREVYHLFDLDAYPYTTEEGLEYEVTPEGICRILRYTGKEETVVLPARVRIGAREYAVSGVAPDAFRDNTTVKLLIVSEGIRLLGVRAFFGMKALKTAVLPSTVTVIPSQCFDGGGSLEVLYLPREVTEIASYAFANLQLSELHYSGTAEELFATPGYNQIYPIPLPEELRVFYGSVYPVVRCFYPLHTPAYRMEDCTLDGIPLSDAEGILFRAVTAPGEQGERVTGLYLEAENRDLLYAKTLSLTHLVYDTFAAEIAPERPGTAISGRQAVCGCTLIAHYDGRLFLSGNPALPGAVFYSGLGEDGRSEPGYFGL